MASRELSRPLVFRKQSLSIREAVDIHFFGVIFMDLNLYISGKTKFESILENYKNDHVSRNNSV